MDSVHFNHLNQQIEEFKKITSSLKQIKKKLGENELKNKVNTCAANVLKEMEKIRRKAKKGELALDANDFSKKIKSFSEDLKKIDTKILSSKKEVEEALSKFQGKILTNDFEVSKDLLKAIGTLVESAFARVKSKSVPLEKVSKFSVPLSSIERVQSAPLTVEKRKQSRFRLFRNKSETKTKKAEDIDIVLKGFSLEDKKRLIGNLIKGLDQYFDEEKLNTEGLFRVQGREKIVASMLLEAVKQKGFPIIPKEADVFDVTTVIKRLLGKSGPILNETEKENLNKVIDGEKTILEWFSSLERDTKSIVKSLMQLLKKVSEHSEQNKMTIKNLARTPGTAIYDMLGVQLVDITKVIAFEKTMQNMIQEIGK